MTLIERLDAAILHALGKIGQSTAFVIERHDDVASVSRAAKVKVRTRIDALVKSGKVKSDGAYQGAVYWM